MRAAEAGQQNKTGIYWVVRRRAIKEFGIEAKPRFRDVFFSMYRIL